MFQVSVDCFQHCVKSSVYCAFQEKINSWFIQSVHQGTCTEVQNNVDCTLKVKMTLPNKQTVAAEAGTKGLSSEMWRV